MNESSIHLSMGESAAEMTLSHIEVLQSSLLGERQDRLALQGRVNELEGTISLLTKQFRHTSIERDVEKARTSLFSDAHADVRSPSLVARTVAALVDYPNVSVCCLLRAGDQWAVVSERSDDHVFLSCALWEGVVRVLELDVVMLDRVAALPADVVAAVNAACQRRLDAYSLRDNLVLTAVHRDCVWLLLSDSSLQALPDSLVGWTALLATATRLVADAFRRQQEDLDREESALVKRVADRVFALLFGAGISTRDDARLALTGVVEASNAILPSCANEVFVVDSNFVGLDSRLELSTIAEGGVLAEAIVSGRLTMCRDPNNSKRDLKLDCGGVVLPLPVVAAVPLWLGAECSGYLVLRLFEPAGRDMVVRRAEQLAAAIGGLLQLWTKQNTSIIFRDGTDVSLELSQSLVSLDRDLVRDLVSRGADCFSSADLLASVSAALQCSWVLVLEGRTDLAAAHGLSLAIYNDGGERRGLVLGDLRPEVRGLVCSLFGIDDDDGATTLENRTGSQRKGVVHLLNGLNSRLSGLQGLLRVSLGPVVNLCGFRIAHPDGEALLALIGGRGWGAFDSAEVCSRASVLSSSFDFVSEHRAMSRLLDVSQKLDSQISVLESDTVSKRLQHSALIDFISAVQSIRQAWYLRDLYDALSALGGGAGMHLDLLAFENTRSFHWVLDRAGVWAKGKQPLLPSFVEELFSLSSNCLIERGDTRYCIVDVESGNSMKLLVCLAVKGSPASTQMDDVAFKSLLLSACAIISGEKSKHTLALLGIEQDVVGGRSACFTSSDLESAIRDELSASSYSSFIGASLLAKLTSVFLPRIVSIPIRIRPELLIDIVNSSTLPAALTLAIRSVTARTNSNDSPSFTWLGNADGFSAYASRASLIGTDIVFGSDRAFLYVNSALANASPDDYIALVVLFSADTIVAPSIFPLLDGVFYEHLLSVQIVNRMLRHIGPLQGADSASQEFVGDMLKMFSIADGSPRDTQALGELQLSMNLKLSLLSTLFDILVQNGRIDLVSSAIERMGSAAMLSAETGVAISWIRPSLSLSKYVHSEEVVKLVVASGKPLLIEATTDEGASRNECASTISYIPVISLSGDSKLKEPTLAIVQFTGLLEKSSRNDELGRRHIVDLVRTVGGVYLSHEKRIASYSDYLTAFAQLLQRVESLASGLSFFEHVNSHISFLLAIMMQANVCVLAKVNDGESSNSRVKDLSYNGSPAHKSEGGLFLAGTVFRWRNFSAVADSSTTYIESSQIPEQGLAAPLPSRPLLQPSDSAQTNSKVYSLVHHVGSRVFLVESSERICPQAICQLYTFGTAVSLMSDIYSIKSNNLLCGQQLKLEKLCRNIHNSSSETDVVRLVETHLSSALHCREVTVMRVPRHLIVDIDQARRQKDSSMFSERGTSNASDAHLAALSLSTDTFLPCKLGTMETQHPTIFIPVIVLDEDPSFAFKIVFERSTDVVNFLENKKIGSEGSRDPGAMEDALVVADSVSFWVRRIGYTKKCQDAAEYASAAFELSTAFSRLFHKSISRVAADMDVESVVSSPTKDFTFTPAKQLFSPKTRSPPSKRVSASTPLEALAYEIVEHNDSLRVAQSIVLEFRLHWIHPQCGDVFEERGWVTHASVLREPTMVLSASKLNGQGDSSRFFPSSVLLESSKSPNTLGSMERKQIAVLPSSSSGCVIYMYLAADSVLEINLSKLVFSGAYLMDGVYLGGRSLTSESAAITKAWECLLSIQKSGAYLLNSFERRDDAIDHLKRTQRFVEDETQQLSVLKECVYDVYGQSASDFKGDRVEGSLRAVQFHLGRLPGVVSVAIVYKSPTGDEFNSLLQTMIPSSTIESSAGMQRLSVEQDFLNGSVVYPFDCHDVKGKILLKYSNETIPDDSSMDAVGKSIAKILGRRIYELNKAAKNRTVLKGKSEELSRKKKELAQVEAERATLVSAVEEHESEVKRLNDLAKVVQQNYATQKLGFEELIAQSLVSVEESKATSETSQRFFETEMLKMKESLSKAKEEHRMADLEKEEIRSKLVAREVSKELAFTSEIASLKKELQLKAELLAKSESANAESTVKKERVESNLESIKELQSSSDMIVAHLRNEIADLKMDKEKCALRVAKRDVKIKEMALMLESVREEREALVLSSDDALSKALGENKELLAQLTDERMKFSALQRSLSSSKEEDVARIENELITLRIEYDNVVKSTVPGLQKELNGAKKQVDDLQRTIFDLSASLSERDQDIVVWKEKFAVQEKERDTLIAGWKDIVSSASAASSSTGISAKSPKLKGKPETSKGWKP